MCDKCRGLGYYYVREDEDQAKRGIRLCECVESVCRCDGDVPYIYFQNGEQKICPCKKYRERLKVVLFMMRNSAVPYKYRFRSFDDFVTHDKEGNTIETLKHVKGVAGTLVEAYDRRKFQKGLLIKGPAGTGKTLLGSIVLNELMFNYAIPCRFMSISYHFFHKLRDTYSESSIDYGRTHEIMDSYANSEVLLIDDFGVQKNTEWELRMLYDLIDQRYQNEKTTFFTTNQNLDSFKQLFEGRIYSRVIEMCKILELDTFDYRKNYLQVIN